MTQNDIIEMARQAGILNDYGEEQSSWLAQTKHIEAFAKLVAAKATDGANARANASWTLMCKKMVEAEREACDAICLDAYEWAEKRLKQDDLDKHFAGRMRAAQDIGNAIRARGEQQ
jgi:hypothetical protein